MFELVRDIISQEFEIEKNYITPESSLRNDLHIDSLAAVNLSFELESKFSLKITDEELAGLKTVSDILDLLDKKGVASLPK